MTDKQNPTQEVEVLPPSALMAIERASIDCQVATAHAYPRSLELYKKRALSMATLDLQTAESCIYSRPVGQGKVAEGASIRLAEIVAASYGNLRVAARIVEQTDRYVKCEGFAWDLESNYGGKSECIEPTVTREGHPYSEGQRAVVAKACLAKAYRDAVFKVVPKALCKSVIDEAIGVINKDVVSLEDRRKRVRDWLKSIKVDDRRVFPLIKVRGWSEVTDDQLILLTGLRTALNDGETTVEEAFPNIPSKPLFEAPSAPAPAPEAASQAAGTPAVETPKPKAAEKQQTPVEKVRSFCKIAGVKEETVVFFLKEVGIAEQDTETLEQLSESALETLITQWDDIAKRVKELAAVTT